ncbi:MAG: ParA family protein [Dethiobacteraceae bacterium]|jgi:chromosome partitioning protein
MGISIVVANNKGGVSKTTTVCNLAAAFAQMGKKTLVCDADPQGNATKHLGFGTHDFKKEMIDVFFEETTPEEVILKTKWENLYLIPTTIDLSTAELKLVPEVQREVRLKKMIDEVKDDFDIILIDSGPALGLINLNAIAAADYVLAPLTADIQSVYGLNNISILTDTVKKRINPNLKILGTFFAMYDKRTSIAREIYEIAHKFSPNALKTRIRINIDATYACQQGVHIFEYNPNSNAAKDYLALAKEVLENVQA